jgi:hypothetical protein
MMAFRASPSDMGRATEGVSSTSNAKDASRAFKAFPGCD